MAEAATIEAEIEQVNDEQAKKQTRKEILRQVRQHARDTNPFVEENDFDYTFLSARSPFEFVEFGEKAYLINN